MIGKKVKAAIWEQAIVTQTALVTLQRSVLSCVEPNYIAAKPGRVARKGPRRQLGDTDRLGHVDTNTPAMTVNRCSPDLSHSRGRWS